MSTRLAYQQPAPHLPARPDRHYITVQQIPQVKRESYENHTRIIKIYVLGQCKCPKVATITCKNGYISIDVYTKDILLLVLVVYMAISGNINRLLTQVILNISYGF